MTRVKRGYIARKRRNKSRLSRQGAHSKLTRTIAQQERRALVSAQRNRDRKKRDFRRLWITRINAEIRKKGVYFYYSKFIHDLHKRQSLFNRKILAQLAILKRNFFSTISNKVIKKEDWKEFPKMISIKFPGE
uniref:Large ribosomal subunit protein bL20c n=2 Tax=Mammillaria TaxID=130139 RepID=A0A5J6VBB3_9CARY|nr:ribosomal protein L20 [Mammillaria huitzilopochtli]QFG71341.1 ribosomal protein L20 [Mammillaria crucigera]